MLNRRHDRLLETLVEREAAVVVAAVYDVGTALALTNDHWVWDYFQVQQHRLLKKPAVLTG